CYQRLLRAAGKFPQVLRVVQLRSAVINHPHRMTGDAIIWIVNAIIEMKGKIDGDELQDAMDRFIESQILIPGRWKPIAPQEISGQTPRALLLKQIQDCLEEHKETV